MRVTPARRRGSSYVGSDKYDALLVISGDQPVMGKKGEIFDFCLSKKNTVKGGIVF